MTLDKLARTMCEREHDLEHNDQGKIVIRNMPPGPVWGVCAFCRRFRKDLAEALDLGVQEQKDRCADADPVHFCNECGSEFLECCHTHMLSLKDEAPDPDWERELDEL